MFCRLFCPSLDKISHEIKLHIFFNLLFKVVSFVLVCVNGYLKHLGNLRTALKLRIFIVCFPVSMNYHKMSNKYEIIKYTSRCFLEDKMKSFKIIRNMDTLITSWFALVRSASAHNCSRKLKW